MLRGLSTGGSIRAWRHCSAGVKGHAMRSGILASGASLVPWLGGPGCAMRLPEKVIEVTAQGWADCGAGRAASHCGFCAKRRERAAKARRR